MRTKNVKFYNMILPIWLIWLYPVITAFVLPANFIIDSLVIIITMKVLKIENIFKKARSIILLVWVFGFIADFIGAALLFGSHMMRFSDSKADDWWYNNIVQPVAFNPFTSIYAFLCVTVSVVIVALLIYFINFKISLRKLDISMSQKKKIALSLAIFTAPYLFYLPTEWFYGL